MLAFTPIDTDSFSLTEAPNGLLQVKTKRYSPLLTDRAQDLQGRWDHRGFWEFPVAALPELKNLLFSAYGTDGEPDTSERVDVVVYLDSLPPRAYAHNMGESIWLFGRKLAHRYYTKGGVELGTGVSVLRGAFPARGGSVKKTELDHVPGTMLEVKSITRKALEREGLWCTGCFELLTPGLRQALQVAPTTVRPGTPTTGKSTPSVDLSRIEIPTFDTSGTPEADTADTPEPAPAAEAPAAPSVRPYLPASQSESLSVFTPANMAFEIQEALKRLKLTYGDIDKFVQQKLQYRNKEQLHGYLSAEQIDAVALAIHNILAGNATIIGDQTGIGKGRIAAAVVRFAVLGGFPTVFCTEKAGLFTDLYRDLMDIGSSDLVPFIFNSDKDANIIIEVEEHGTKVSRNIAEVKRNAKYRPPSSPGAVESQLRGARSLPEGYHFVMTTYSQFSDDYQARIKKLEAEKAKGEIIIKARQRARNEKTEFLRRYAKDAVFIMDESHNASGEASAIGFFTRDILEASRGVCFLSATYAKNAAALPTYAIKTTIKEAGLNSGQLIDTFSRGGTALQEIVASDLVKAGQMIRRQRSFDGIKFEFDYLEQHYEKHRKIFDKVSRIVRDIILFQKEHIFPFLEELGATGGGKAGVVKGTEDGGLNNTPYFNKVYHVLSQLMFSLKAAEVAKEAVRHLNENKKVVIAFDHTMGSFLAELGYADGDTVASHDFSLVLVKGMESILRYSYERENGEKETEAILPEDLSAEARAEYDRIMAEIRSASSGVSFSPVDVLVNILENTPRPNGTIGGSESQYYRVRECTGRAGRIRIENGKAVYRSYKADKKLFFREFNNGDADVLLLNQSASTGVSCHASATFKDQRQRVMLVHEPMLRIDTMVQMLGRVNRTGQVVKPEYYYISSSVPAEKKLFMVLKKKLKSLDANTSGSQRSSQETLEVEDFYNKYGLAAILKVHAEPGMLQGFQQMTEQAYLPAIIEGQDIEDKLREVLNGGSGVAEAKVNKFVNELAVQQTDVQERIYDAIIASYEELVNEAKATGEYDLEVEYLDYQAEPKATYLFAKGRGGTSIFGQDAYEQVFSARNLRKPYKWSVVQAMQEKALGGRTPREALRQLQTAWEPRFEQYATERKALAEENVDAAQQDVTEAEAALMKAKAAGDEKKVERAERKKESAEKQLEAVKTKQEYLAAGLDYELQTIKKHLDYFEIGKPVLIPIEEEDTVRIVPGLVVEVNRQEGGYAPSAFFVQVVVASPERSVKVKFNKSDTISRIKEATARMPDSLRTKILGEWNKLAAASDRIELNLITNNVLLGISKAIETGNGTAIKLIKFSTAKGEIINGIERSKKAIEESGTVLPAGAMKDVVMSPTTPMYEPIVLKAGRLKVDLKRMPFGKMGIVVIAAKDHQPVWGDEDLGKLIERTPEQVANGSYAAFTKGAAGAVGTQFGAVFAGENVDKALTILENLGFSGQVERKAVKAGDLPGEADATPENTRPPGRYVYELSEPFRAGAYPAEHFDSVTDYPGNPHGAIVYTRPLTAKQRYSAGLIPVFDSIDVPFNEWKTKSLQSAVQREWDELLDDVRGADAREAVRRLGRFILAYAHEDGNPEFVFGRYTLEDLGRKAYREFIAKELPEEKPAPAPAPLTGISLDEKARRLRLLKLREKERARKIAILKLKAQQTSAQRA